MTDQEKGAKGSDSPSDDKGAKGAGSPPVEEVIAENKRKAQEIAELKEKYESLVQEKEERLAELQEKARLSSSEREEMETLEDQVQAIKRDKRSKPWLKLNEETSQKIAQAAVAEHDAKVTDRMVRKYAKSQNVSFEKFEPVIVKFMQRVDPLGEMPSSVRAEEAYDLFLEEKKLMEEREERKDKDKNFSDSSQKATRVPSKTEILDEAIGKNRTDKGLEKLLKGLGDVHQEATSR